MRDVFLKILDGAQSPSEKPHYSAKLVKKIFLVSKELCRKPGARVVEARYPAFAASRHDGLHHDDVPPLALSLPWMPAQLLFFGPQTGAGGRSRKESGGVGMSHSEISGLYCL
jgi:hypothetical protein